MPCPFASCMRWLQRCVQIQRWRYAGPVECWPDATVTWGFDPVIALAGEAFAGPKVEGAFLSGRAAADAVLAS